MKRLKEIFLHYPGHAASSVFRIARELHRARVPLLPRMMMEHAQSRTGIDIHPGATIGRRVLIDHGTGVVVGETSRIGDDVRIYQGVTLGAFDFPKDPSTGALIRGARRYPTIEDRVVIYANATVLCGDTVVGRHAVIGSSARNSRSGKPYTCVPLEGPALRFRESCAWIIDIRAKN